MSSTSEATTFAPSAQCSQKAEEFPVTLGPYSGNAWLEERFPNRDVCLAVMEYYYEHPDELPDRRKETDHLVDQKLDVLVDFDEYIFDRKFPETPLSEEEKTTAAPDELRAGDSPMSEEQCDIQYVGDCAHLELQIPQESPESPENCLLPTVGDAVRRASERLSQGLAQISEPLKMISKKRKRESSSESS